MLLSLKDLILLLISSLTIYKNLNIKFYIINLNKKNIAVNNY